MEKGKVWHEKVQHEQSAEKTMQKNKDKTFSECSMNKV